MSLVFGVTGKVMSVGWKKMRDLTFFVPLKNWVYTTDTQKFLILLKINTVIHA